MDANHPRYKGKINRSYTHSDFRRKLQRLNPGLRFKFSENMISGIYLVTKRSFQRDFAHVASMPSPRHYFSIPQADYLDVDRLDREGNPSFQRGWNSIVCNLINKRVFSRSAAKRSFSCLKGI